MSVAEILEHLTASSYANLLDAIGLWKLNKF